MRARANIVENRLYLDFNGVVSSNKMEALYTDIRFAVADLSPGFDVISDYSGCRVLQLDSLPPLKKIIGFLIENGLGEVARIITRDQVSYKQILNLNVRVQGYKPIYAVSLDEAEEKLNDVTRRNGVRVHLHDVLIEYDAKSHKGSGRVVDISISGCAIELHSEPKELTVSDTIFLRISFDYKAETPQIFTLKSNAVRIEGNLLAVEYIELEDEQRDQLWKRILAESRS